MEVKEIIKKVYQKNGVQVDDDYIEYKMKDEQKVKDFIRLYKQEEIDSMNYILRKPENNNKFTKFELNAMSKIDLFDKKVIKICKFIWENRNDDEKLEEILKILKEEKNNGNTSRNLETSKRL